jgi:hypothetical protein
LLSWSTRSPVVFASSSTCLLPLLRIISVSLTDPNSFELKLEHRSPLPCKWSRLGHNSHFLATGALRTRARSQEHGSAVLWTTTKGIVHHKQRGGSRSLSRKLRAAWRKWHRYGFPLAHTAAIVQDACVINCPERERARECVCVRVYARALARSIQASIQMAFSHPTKNQMAPK